MKTEITKTIDVYQQAIAIEEEVENEQIAQEWAEQDAEDAEDY
jgi:hypothetical protein